MTLGSGDRSASPITLQVAVNGGAKEFPPPRSPSTNLVDISNSLVIRSPVANQTEIGYAM